MAEFATVARPYANALFSLATEKNQVDNWLNNLAELAWLMKQSNVVDFLNQADKSYVTQADDLLNLLSQSAISQEFKNFVYLVAQEKRLVVLPDIYIQYENLALASNNVKEAVVYTAYDIATEGQRAKIISDLEEYFNTRLKASFVVEPNLIGGLKIEVGDQVLDLSVQGKLKVLHTTMIN